MTRNERRAMLLKHAHRASYALQLECLKRKRSIRTKRERRRALQLYEIAKRLST